MTEQEMRAKQPHRREESAVEAEFRAMEEKAAAAAKDIEELADAADAAEETAKAAAAGTTQAVKEAVNRRIVPRKEHISVSEAPAESMDDYRTELESSFRKIREGDILTGTVISVNEAGALMDLNYYASGIIPAEEMSDDPHFSILGEVKVGDVLTGVVSKRDDGRGHILLSRREADRELAWGRLRKLMKEKTNITGKVTELTKAGAIMYLEGVRGFIPNSKLGLTYVEDNAPYLNRQLDVRVAEVDEENKRLILSAKEILQEQAIAEKNRRIEALTVGNVVEGTVESLKDYGAFVTIAEGISGLLHISQISNTRVKNIRSVLKEGQPVKVLITKIEGGKISLSMKAVEDMINTEKAEEEPSEYSDGGQATTSLADLLKGLKF